MGISAWNKKMVWGHFISDIIDSDVLKILLWTREVFSAYVLVWKTKTFSYTWADQVFEVPEDCNMTIECWGAWSNNASWWYAKWVVPVTKWQKLSFMIWWNWGRTNDWTTYWFGWSTTYWGRWGWWLSWVFTWDTAIGANDASRVLVIAWWAWWGRTWGWAWGWENWQNWNGGSYWYPWAWGTQTWRWNWGNTRSEQFRWGGWSWTYWFGWGGWWRWWNGSWWDGSWDDDAQAGWGSGHVIATATDVVLTQWGWSSAGQDWSVKIRYLVKERPQPTPKARLPHEYQEVEYIESTGTQWIDSWYIPKSTSWFEMKFRNISAINTYRTLIWTRTDTSTAAFWIWWMNSKCYMEMSPANIEYTRSDGWFNTGIDYEMSFLNKTLICNWETFQSWTNFTQDSARNLYIFSWNSNWQAQPFEAAASRMYYLKLYEWENLVRDFVPCYRVSDWAAWLYDLVEWKFYTNAWTWTFTKWAPVNVWQMPSWYTELQYIQSSWTQYIETDIVPSNTKWVYLKVSSQDVSNDKMYLGSNDNSSDTWSKKFWIGNSSNKLYFWWNSWLPVSQNRPSTTANTVVELENNFLNSRLMKKDNNTIYSISETLTSNWFPINIFWHNGWWTAQYFSNIELYSCKISDWSNIIADFVPCVRDSDGVIWLYDLVTKQFFTNSWTWNFVAGPIIMRDWFKLSANTIAHLLLNGNTDYEWSSITWTNPWSDITYETVSWEIQAIRFKGNANSFLWLTWVPEMNTDFTIWFWIKQYSAGTAQIFVERWTSNNTNCDLHYIMRDTNKIDLWFYANDCPWNTAISASTWYHLCATYKYSTREMKTYINAVADWTLTWSWNPSFGTGPLYLWWKKSYESNSPVNGAMSDFFRENKVRSQEQIQQYVRWVEWRYR